MLIEKKQEIKINPQPRRPSPTSEERENYEIEPHPTSERD